MYYNVERYVIFKKTAARETSYNEVEYYNDVARLWDFEGEMLSRNSTEDSRLKSWLYKVDA